MDVSELRSYTFTWHDYRQTTAAAAGLTGRQYLEGMRGGTFPPPPFVALLGFALEEVGDGQVVFRLTPQEFMQNGIGLLHGGVAATLLDTAVGCACLTVVPEAKVAVTLDLAVRYFKPLTLRSGVVRCDGRVINTGRTTITAEGRMTDATGRLCAHATSTLALIDAAAVR